MTGGKPKFVNLGEIQNGNSEKMKKKYSWWRKGHTTGGLTDYDVWLNEVFGVEWSIMFHNDGYGITLRLLPLKNQRTHFAGLSVTCGTYRTTVTSVEELQDSIVQLREAIGQAIVDTEVKVAHDQRYRERLKIERHAHA